MGNMKKGTRKKKNVKASEVEYVCTIEPEQNLEDTEHQSGEQHEQPPVENDEEHELPAAENDEEPELPAAENGEEPELPAAEHELPANETESELPAPQPKHKIKRGPTRLKHIAKDPSTREKVDYNEKGQPIGPGSKLLSSYAGCLVREHVPVTIADWRLVSQELKTVLWKSIQARFEVDEEYQKIQVLGQMGCDWRSYKSRLATAVRKAPTNKDRMDLKPKNMLVNDWRRFIKDKTSKSFKVVSDKFKKIRKIQIPHTVSRKGMARLEEEMKMEAPEPSEISRTDVWVRSRTKKDGTPVNTVAAEKIRKAAELKNDVLAEGRWESKEPDALVNGLPIGPNAVKVFVDVVIEPKTFLWRPTTEISRRCLEAYFWYPVYGRCTWTSNRMARGQSGNGLN